MGRFVSELREQRGLSADDLARIVRTTPRRLLALEGGRAMLPPTEFQALAGYFEVSVAELFLGRRFVADDAPETVSAAQTDADSYRLFCTSSRRMRLRRFLAVLIDIVLLLLPYILILAFIPNWKNGALFYVPLGLWLLHDAIGRCSIGKALLRLRIVNGRTLARASLWRRLVRNLPLRFPPVAHRQSHPASDTRPPSGRPGGRNLCGEQTRAAPWRYMACAPCGRKT